MKNLWLIHDNLCLKQGDYIRHYPKIHDNHSK